MSFPNSLIVLCQEKDLFFIFRLTFVIDFFNSKITIQVEIHSRIAAYSDSKMVHTAIEGMRSPYISLQYDTKINYVNKKKI